VRIRKKVEEHFDHNFLRAFDFFSSFQKHTNNAEENKNVSRGRSRGISIEICLVDYSRQRKNNFKRFARETLGGTKTSIDSGRNVLKLLKTKNCQQKGGGAFKREN
jgi:hypothetical protein